MKIHTESNATALTICAVLIEKGAGFHLHTLEIFQHAPVIETGTDMWETLRPLIQCSDAWVEFDPDPKQECGTTHGDYICTEELGHTGDHMAMDDRNRVVCRWRQT